MNSESWLKKRQYTPDQFKMAHLVLEEIRQGAEVTQAIRRHPLPGGGYLAKHTLVAAYRALLEMGVLTESRDLLARIRMKPIRTLSGVTTVTVLTCPHPCPGDCIFCPDDIRMPKSYIPDEPGARRALENNFDPYDQVSTRVTALQAVGHPTEKIELLILGGSWTAYQRDYQEWFIQRCFDALNQRNSSSLSQAFQWNETSQNRNVGLVVETRPDHIDRDQIAWFRRLGVTKVQMGVQSLDDQILAINRRGHTYYETQQAVALLRAASFKIALHWMPNLLGATPESDRRDFERLWEDLCPDEIKIYPTQLLENTGLYQVWKKGEYHPYTTRQLIQLIADIKTTIPRYCRVNRVIRDIPSTYVVEGNKRTSLRQDVQNELRHRGERCQCIRCREIRNRPFELKLLQQNDLVYFAGGSEEHFLSYHTPDDRLAGFLRLSLPGSSAPDTSLADLQNSALIREIHVYGQSLQIGLEANGAAQHSGLGISLMEWAEEIARQNHFSNLAVISAIGTRQYYLQRGFERGELYLVKKLV